MPTLAWALTIAIDATMAAAAGCSRPVSPPPERAAISDAGLSTDGPSPSVVTTGGRPAGTDAGMALAIIDTPIAWSAERERLTLAYRRAHSDPAAADLTIVPRAIVLHYTAGSSAVATRRYFDRPRIESARAQLARAGAVNVSAHFIVDRDGTIFRLQPETRYARHCIGLNHLAIGIENVGDNARWPLTQAQVAANVALVRELARRFPITHLLGHHEVMRFRSSPYYVELDRSYHNDKPDPGAGFMADVRAGLVDLGLTGL
ncbi:MAG: peptidoglycan recognition family protein [Kofleriaceae bacterium]